jgi:hypothetical protein
VRPGSNPRLARSLQLFRICCDEAGASSSQNILHAALYPESNYSALSSWAFHYSSLNLLSETYKWIYLDSHCDLRIPSALRRYTDGKALPKSRGLSRSVATFLKHAPDGPALAAALTALTAERAMTLAQTPPGRTLAALRAVIGNDVSWQVETDSERLFIGNDAGKPVLEIFLASVPALLT